MKRFFSVFLALISAFSLSVVASARLVGDIDSGGSVNSSDALRILRYTVGQLTEINMSADINGDGRVNSSDALIALKIAVGSYDGELEADDGQLTTYKRDIIDPIISTGKFTLKTQTEGEDGISDVTVMVNGNDICAETVNEKITARVLVLDSETYIVIPDFIMPGVGVYSEYDGDFSVNIGGGTDAQYVKSEYVMIDGEQLVCETYELSNGSVSKYYFRNGSWVMLSVEADGVTTTQKVTELKSGVTQSYFSINGLIKLNLGL